jgi:hypothetical protein
MTRIVTTTYRYKRPPRKRMAVALDVPAIVRKSSRRPIGEEKAAAAEVMPPTSEEGAAQRSTARGAARATQPAANDDRADPATSSQRTTKSAIVTIKRKSRFGDAPDMTPEEHRRRGEAADALFRRVTGRDP